MNRKTIIFIVPLLLALFLGIKLVSSSGTTSPWLIGENLPKGSTAKFIFVISNGGNNFESSCTYSVESLDPLTVTFDESQVVIAPNEPRNVKGSITASANAEEKRYSGNLIVACSPMVSSSVGNAAMVKTYTVPFDVNVVSEAPVTTTPIITTIPQENPAISTSTILIIIILVVVIIGIGYWFIRKKEVKRV